MLKIADAVARVASAIKNRASLLTPQCPSARLGKFSAQEGAGPLSFKHDAAQVREGGCVWHASCADNRAQHV